MVKGLGKLQKKEAAETAACCLIINRIIGMESANPPDFEIQADFESGGIKNFANPYASKVLDNMVGRLPLIARDDDIGTFGFNHTAERVLGISHKLVIIDTLRHMGHRVNYADTVDRQSSISFCVYQAGDWICCTAPDNLCGVAVMKALISRPPK